MQTSDEPCESCLGACQQKEDPSKYNKRVEDAVASLQDQPSYAIVDKGLDADQQSLVVVIDGSIYGMGYVSSDTTITNMDSLKDIIKPLAENSFIHNLVHSYAARFPSKVRPL
jgi:DNA polymerase-3 subunit epsilon